jgi:hypothetical protein
MRTLPVEVIPGLIVLLIAGGAALGQAQNASEKPAASASAVATQPASPAKEEKPKPAELERMLAEALVHNPDIRVAEAKLREAEAELNRVRFQVLQKVSTLHHTLESQKGTINASGASLQYSKRLFEKGSLSFGEIFRAEALLGQEKAKLATLEAELPALLGRPPQSASPENKDSQAAETTSWEGLVRLWDMTARSSGSFGARASDAACLLCHQATAWPANHTELASHSLGRLFESAHQSRGQLTQGAMADKIRKALDMPVTIDIKDKSLSEVIKVFEEKASGIPFHTVLAGRMSADVRVSLHLEQVPLGAALQALEDSFADGGNLSVQDDGLRLAVREYGILVTSRGRLPRGATLLHDFWKGHTGQEKVKESAAPEPAAEKTAPPQDIEGVIKATDVPHGMVTISIGSDAGLRKGHTLEVYRLKPEPKYLGSIRILSVRPTEAVARPVRESAAAMEIGDRVTSRIQQR